MVLGYLLIALLLLCSNAFFVLAEFSSIRIRPTRVEELKERGDARARAVLHIQEHLDEYLSACQLGVTFSSVGLGFVGELALARLIEQVVEGPLQLAIAHTIAVTCAYLAVSFLHILLGELVPKYLAIRSPEWAFRTARPLAFFYKLFWIPLVVLNRSANAILTLVGAPRKATDERHSEEELKIILQQSQEGGVMPFRRLLFLENIFDLGDLRVCDAMRARSGVKVLRAGASWDENFKIARESRFSRYPLIDPQNDKPLGIVHVKDLVLAGPEKMAALDLKKIARPFLTTTMDAPVERLLTDLQRKRGHMTIVLDRDAKFAGVITMEDIIEEIIGTVEDEFETEPSIYLGDAVTLGRIVLDLEAASIEDAIRAALARAASELPQPPERVLPAILERERQMSTYLGQGLAIPHGRLEGLEKPVVIFARSKGGVPIKGKSERAHIIFILLTPAGAPHAQVRLLARIGGIMESEFVVERLREAENAQQILEAIRAGETASLG